MISTWDCYSPWQGSRKSTLQYSGMPAETPSPLFDWFALQGLEKGALSSHQLA
ncbi:MAG: hypothetical protein ACUVRV_01625 [Cyanobacteriota bacterium]